MRSEASRSGCLRCPLALGAVLVVRDQADREHREPGDDVEGGEPAVGVAEVERERRDHQQRGRELVAGRVHGEREHLHQTQRIVGEQADHEHHRTDDDTGGDRFTSERMHAATEPAGSSAQDLHDRQARAATSAATADQRVLASGSSPHAVVAK